MRRVSVVGNSGSGKSTLARALADALGLPLLELDGVRHQPGWRELPDEEFAARVDAFTAADRWVVDGNYTIVRVPIVWPRADTVVWLDPPRLTATRQVLWRTLRRVATGEELWNGNRETWRDALAWDPRRSVVRSSWTRHRLVRNRYRQAMDDVAWAHLTFLRVPSRQAAAALVADARGVRLTPAEE